MPGRTLETMSLPRRWCDSLVICKLPLAHCNKKQRFDVCEEGA